MEFFNKNKSTIITGLLIITILVLAYLLSGKNSSYCEPCAKCDNPNSSSGSGSGSGLSTGTQDANIKKDQPTIICYYATWCGHSRMFLPKWDEFEKYAKNALPNIAVKKLECKGENEKVCTSRGVSGFPTVIMYNGGKKVDYEGDRSVESLITFCKQNM